MWKKIRFDVLFVGDDWYNSERWQELEKKFNEVNVRVVYFPYTKGTSSTLINQTLTNLRKDSTVTVDKNFCASSFLAYRYIEKDGMEFAAGLKHKNPTGGGMKTKIFSAKDIDVALEENFSKVRDKKLGLMLSGGMDSAILASYMKGCDAYTFRFLDGNFQADELNRAEFYAKTYGLNLHYVDINFERIDAVLDLVMKNKCAPVHSIEPQIFLVAKQAMSDGVEIMFIGNSSDPVFGGFNELLAEDWNFDDFVKRYTFLNPFEVLENPVDVNYLFERYRLGNKIDFHKFMDEVYSVESSGSYLTAFETAGLKHFDPYSNLEVGEPLDLTRIRNGESKYLIRELFKMKYPNFPVPEKVPMPRPVDIYFENWQGPIRAEFKSNLDMKKFTGNQKWQLYCLERFLNLLDENFK